MPPTAYARQYQLNAIATASPERLIAKLYDLGVAACHRGDRAHLRAVLVALVEALDPARGGEIAERLGDLYSFCLAQTGSGDLGVVAELLGGLREAWAEGVLRRAPLAAAA